MKLYSDDFYKGFRDALRLVRLKQEGLQKAMATVIKAFDEVPESYKGFLVEDNCLEETILLLEKYAYFEDEKKAVNA